MKALQINQNNRDIIETFSLWSVYKALHFLCCFFAAFTFVIKTFIVGTLKLKNNVQHCYMIWITG